MTKALIVVDLQQDFTPGGSLAVESGGLVAERVNRHIRHYSTDYLLVAATKDWHPGHFGQFTHFSNEPDYIDTWPPHCVHYTPGAKFHPAFYDEDEILGTKLEG